MRTTHLLSTFVMAAGALLSGCEAYEPIPVVSGHADAAEATDRMASIGRLAAIPLGSAATFAVLAGTTVTNDGETAITADLGVSPGTAITGFHAAPLNTISGPGTVTAGLGIVSGTIYAGGPVAAAAHNDAGIAYNALVARTPDTIYNGVTQLDGMTFTPGTYSFAPSANLQVNGTVYLDFQGNSNALFVFQMGTTLVTMTGSKVIALNNNDTDCLGSNVFWAVGSSATIDGAQFIGNVIATTTITMTSGSNVSGRLWALNGAVTLIDNSITACATSDGNEPKPPKRCNDFVTGGGNMSESSRYTFGVSGGIKNGKTWGNLSFHDHRANGIKVKSTTVTSYTVIDATTRQIEGNAIVNGRNSFTYKVVVSDNGEPGNNDLFSLELSNGYHVSGMLTAGNIQLHKECE